MNDPNHTVWTIAIAIAKAHLKTRPFEIRSSKNPDFECFGVSGFKMFPDFEWSDFRSPLH